jgi:hypothetical protein
MDPRRLLYLCNLIRPGCVTLEKSREKREKRERWERGRERERNRGTLSTRGVMAAHAADPGAQSGPKMSSIFRISELLSGFSEEFLRSPGAFPLRTRTRARPVTPLFLRRLQSASERPCIMSACVHLYISFSFSLSLSLFLSLSLTTHTKHTHTHIKEICLRPID